MKSPIYKTIIEQLKKEIENLDANAPIPSERELTRRYDASRMTVRKAIVHLVDEGYLYRDGNKGTFVADQNLRKEKPDISTIKGLRESNSMRILYFDIKKGLPEVAARLNIRVDDRYIRIVRLNLKDDKPESIEEIYFVHEMLDHGDMLDVDAVFEFTGRIETGSTKQEFIPNLVPVQYANLLNIDIGTPIIRIDSTIYSKDGSVFAFSKCFVNPNVKKVEMTF